MFLGKYANFTDPVFFPSGLWPHVFNGDTDCGCLPGWGKRDDLEVIRLAKFSVHTRAVCEANADVPGRLEPLHAAVGQCATSWPRMSRGRALGRIQTSLTGRVSGNPISIQAPKACPSASHAFITSSPIAFAGG